MCECYDLYADRIMHIMNRLIICIISSSRLFISLDEYCNRLYVVGDSCYCALVIL